MSPELRCSSHLLRFVHMARTSKTPLLVRHTIIVLFMILLGYVPAATQLTPTHSRTGGNYLEASADPLMSMRSSSGYEETALPTHVKRDGKQQLGTGPWYRIFASAGPVNSLSPENDTATFHSGRLCGLWVKTGTPPGGYDFFMIDSAINKISHIPGVRAHGKGLPLGIIEPARFSEAVRVAAAVTIPKYPVLWPGNRPWCNRAGYFLNLQWRARGLSALSGGARRGLGIGFGSMGSLAIAGAGYGGIAKALKSSPQKRQPHMGGMRLSPDFWDEGFGKGHRAEGSLGSLHKLALPAKQHLPRNACDDPDRPSLDSPKRVAQAFIPRLDLSKVKGQYLDYTTMHILTDRPSLEGPKKVMRPVVPRLDLTKVKGAVSWLHQDASAD